MFAVEEILILCGLAGIFRKYKPVFLAEKNVYKLKKIKRGNNKYTLWRRNMNVSHKGYFLLYAQRCKLVNSRGQ